MSPEPRSNRVGTTAVGCSGERHEWHDQSDQSIERQSTTPQLHVQIVRKLDRFDPRLDTCQGWGRSFRKKSYVAFGVCGARVKTLATKKMDDNLGAVVDHVHVAESITDVQAERQYIVAGAWTGNGTEAWRKLTLRWDPKMAVRRRKLSGMTERQEAPLRENDAKEG